MATATFRISGQRVLIRAYAGPSDLPPEARAMLDHARFFFETPAWWRATIAAALPQGAEPRFLYVSIDDRPAALFPMLRAGRRWQGLTTLYTYRYAPLLAPDLPQALRLVACEAFGRFIRGGGVTRLDSLAHPLGAPSCGAPCGAPLDAPLDALPLGVPDHATLLAGLRRAGLVPLPFNHFATWEEDVTGQDWDTYLSHRDGRLRETIRRRLRDIRARPDARFAILTSDADIAAATDAYEAVAARSWKQPEPFPAFNRTLFREAARDGALFMTRLTLGDRPVAVQAWAVHRGRATVLKLVHDEDLARLSPGTVLTALSIQHLLRDRALSRLDFGRGDDAYKKMWVRERHQRTGLLIATPWHPSGLAAIVRRRLATALFG